MINQPKTTRLLERLRAYVAELRRLGAIPADLFLADPDKVGNAKYHFVVAIEACIDLANHVIAAEGFRTPKDNADTFTVLVEHGAVEGFSSNPCARWHALGTASFTCIGTWTTGWYANIWRKTHSPISSDSPKPLRTSPSALSDVAAPAIQ